MVGPWHRGCSIVISIVLDRRKPGTCMTWWRGESLDRMCEGWCPKFCLDLRSSAEIRREPPLIRSFPHSVHTQSILLSFGEAPPRIRRFPHTVCIDIGIDLTPLWNPATRSMVQPAGNLLQTTFFHPLGFIMNLMICALVELENW